LFFFGFSSILRQRDTHLFVLNPFLLPSILFAAEGLEWLAEGVPALPLLLHFTLDRTQNEAQGIFGLK